MSSLLHPLQSASQKCRPKHQVLILRCYPKFQKNVAEIKPNSSELSYLLYYASTRRSKLQKVGAFLEKKTASDVWRQRLGNVQVTLQILTAIIEKTPRDITLYASNVFTILETVLRSKDINMVEETLPTWEAYCKHVDVPALIADKTQSQHYVGLVKLFTSYASPTERVKAKSADSVPMSIRWRTASLRAVRAVVSSDAIAVDASAQLKVVMPVIFENLALSGRDVLKSLQQKANISEKQSTEIARKRRMSVGTIDSLDLTDADPATASGTTAHADKVAEEEVRVLALRSLKQIFSISTSSTRGQTRLATALTLKFIASKQKPVLTSEKGRGTIFQGNWATSLFESIARWTPVQDRFVIVLTAMESLIRSPIVEAGLDEQLVLAQMIGWLLRSDVNLIGLSVMDVLLGLISHLLVLLQLGGRDSNTVPHAPNHDTFGIYREAHDTFTARKIAANDDLSKTQTKDETVPSPTRIELATVLQHCVSDLATHIYYTDQISDMITAILTRLKPSPTGDVASTTAAINNPLAATKSIAESASLREDPSTDGFFSFATARVIALKAVKDIINTANNRRTNTGQSAEARSRVGVQVWEGTQWLLKDENQDVRFAYVDAVLTWLKKETSKVDMLLPRDGTRKQRSGKKKVDQDDDQKLARRAVSNASRKEKPIRSTFYQLLHLAIHDNAIDHAEDEADIVLLHLLLSTLVDRLGVNALRSGLPMILALQVAALMNDDESSSGAKVNVASLVHGYLWNVADKFDLDTTRDGSDINIQISRRKQLGIWLDKIRFPPTSIDQISKSTGSEEKEISESAVKSMKPFLEVKSLVDGIAASYDKSLTSPPTSPPSSPGRVFSVPTLGFGYGYGLSPIPRPAPEDAMPQRVKDEMCGSWSREVCIANVDKESAASLSGSRTGPSSSVQQRRQSLVPANGAPNGRESPASPQDGIAQQTALNNGLGSISKKRHGDWSGSAIQLTTSSNRDSTIRVSDLKRALSGYDSALRSGSPLRRPLTSSRRSFRESDADSDSMVSWDGQEELDASFVDGEAGPRPGTAVSRRDFNHQDPATVDDDIPPVPRIPSALNLPGTFPRDTSPLRQHPMSKGTSDAGQTETPQSKRLTNMSSTSLASRPRMSKRMSSRPTTREGPGQLFSAKVPLIFSSTSAKQDLAGFLAAIDTGSDNSGLLAGDKEKGRKRLVAPPY